MVEHDRDTALSTGGDQDLSSMLTVTIQVTAESSHDPSGAPGASPGDALWLLEHVRLGLRRISVADALALAECPIVGFPLATVSRGYPADGRIISAHSFDVAFRVTMALDPDESLEQIERVEGEGDGGLDGADIAVDDPTPE